MDPITKFDDLLVRQLTWQMADQIKKLLRIDLIIAMKGEAYTGKTTCAEAIAEAYNCPVISFDQILDSLSRSGRDANELIDLAFDIILSTVGSQIDLSRPVIIDSPLTKQSHLDKLVALADEKRSCKKPECKDLHCGLVVVDCKPNTEYAWERRFEERDKANHDSKWYKPTKWNDIVSEHKKLSQSNPITPGLHGVPSYVCRLIVDTTYCVPRGYHNLGAATLDIGLCGKGHVFDFREWHPNSTIHPNSNPAYLINKISGRTGPSQPSQPSQPSSNMIDLRAPPVTPVNCGDDGRHMLEKVTAPAEGLGLCRACHKDISYTDEDAYACTRCRLALHKSCTELPEKSTIPDPSSNLPSHLRVLSSPDEFYCSIPEEYKSKYKCSYCTEFSVYCEFCLWAMHLESRVVPTIVLHEGHQHSDGPHPVWFWVTSASNPRLYRCEACRLPGACIGYTCLTRTFLYSYHVECALLPRPVRHHHGGYHHDMELVFGTDEKKEDYICDVCLKPMLDPDAWCYYCPECIYVSHLNCIYVKDQ